MRLRPQPPRRLRVTRSGWTLALVAVGLGLAALPTGNNLLYLLLGAVLGLIGLSGVLSEAVLRGVQVEREPVRAVAGRPARVGYRVRNVHRRWPSYVLEIGERDHPARAFVAYLAPGTATVATLVRTWPRRGVVRLEELVVATAFPFGLFVKELRFRAPQEVLVWPRYDRPLPRDAAAVAGHRPTPTAARAGRATRGEFRALRDYRPGDDVRDVHWRSTARRGRPVVREYDPEGEAPLWLGLWPGPDPERAEAAIELAASLAVHWLTRGRAVGLRLPHRTLPPAPGEAQRTALLDALARLELGAFPPPPPPPGGGGLLVSTAGPAPGWPAPLAP